MLFQALTDVVKTHDKQNKGIIVKIGGVTTKLPKALNFGNMTNAKHIIHAVGPDFSHTHSAFKELFDAYYNSRCVLKENDLHSISFPLISSGIFGGDLPDPAGESTKQCCRAYNKFTSDYPDYEIEVKLCAFTQREMTSAQSVFSKLIK